MVPGARLAVVPFAFMALVSNAWAQRVALVRPSDADHVLVDAYNRLNAELHLHAFDVLLLDKDSDGETQRTLAEAAHDTDALAAISFVRRGRERTVDVWLVDRATGKTTMRTLEPHGANDAATVLAIRAVDLLRISLRELASADTLPPELRDATGRAIPKATLEFLAPQPSWSVRVEGTVLVDRPLLGRAYGAGFAVLGKPSRRVELGAAVAATFLGTGWRTPQGSASVRHQLGWGELGMALLQSDVAELGAALLLGAHRLEALGEANAPLLSRSDEVWSVFGGLGVSGRVRITPSTTFVLAVRALLLAPKAGVAIGNDKAILDVPMLHLAAGLMMGL